MLTQMKVAADEQTAEIQGVVASMGESARW